MQNGFSHLTTSDILVVLADSAKRCSRILSREGLEVDLREFLQEGFDRQAAHRKDIDPKLPEHSPDYDQQYRALQELFWHLYDQAEENLRVYDEPVGEA